MNPHLRFALAPILGIVVAIVTYIFLSGVHPIFLQLGLIGLIPALIGGLAGGAVVAIIAPQKKVVLSLIAGALLAAPLLAFLLRHGFSHSGHPALLSYWPMWLPLYFASGVSCHVTRGVPYNTALERTVKGFRRAARCERHFTLAARIHRERAAAQT